MQNTCVQETSLEPISILIAAFALIVSIFAYIENRKSRIENGQAYILFELFQVESKVYIVISNIGNTFAYNVNINISEPFINVFDNLNTIRPNCSYRYCLLDKAEIASYPETVTISISYNDFYSSRHAIKKRYSFCLIDYLKFNIEYNQKDSCFDIKKSF